MEELSIQDIIDFTNAKVLSAGSLSVYINKISTDTRDMKRGELFLALVGERFDGHNFINVAVEKGAVAIIVSMGLCGSLGLYRGFEGVWVLGVVDTLGAYQDIARCYLSRLSVKKIAITGTSGKTSTRELISTMLSLRYDTLSSAGNFNNQVGVPRTVLEIESRHSLAVIELASGKAGDIMKLSRIVKPDYAIITNIGLAHSEFIGDLSAIANEKKDIFAFLGEGSKKEGSKEEGSKEEGSKEEGSKKEGVGKAVLDADGEYFSFLSSGVDNILSFSFSRCPLFRVKRNLGIDGYLLEYEGIDCHFSLAGDYNLVNLHFAIVLAREFGFSSEEVARGIGFMSPGVMRGEIIRSRYIIIKDCYNANPVSMRAGLEFLSSLGGDFSFRRLAILGDMRELGVRGEEYHNSMGFFFTGLGGIDYLLTLGFLGSFIGKGAISSGYASDRVFIFSDREELFSKLLSLIRDGDILYFKASRALHLEELADRLV